MPKLKKKLLHIDPQCFFWIVDEEYTKTNDPFLFAQRLYDFAIKSEYQTALKYLLEYEINMHSKNNLRVGHNDRDRVISHVKFIEKVNQLPDPLRDLYWEHTRKVT